MNLKSLLNKGKKIVDERGGVESLKQDAAQLKDIAKGKGSLTDKAKDAAAAIKEPGARGAEDEPAGAGKPDPGKPRPDRPHAEGEHPKQP